MPGPMKKLWVVAAVEGLVLYPSGQRNQRSLQIKYTTHELSSVPYSKREDSLSSLELHGIAGSQLLLQLRKSSANVITTVLGLLTVTSVAYLITIVRREQVAHIRGCPIYVITDVALIPLSSHSEAQKAIEQTKESLKRSGQNGAPSKDSDTSDDDETHSEAGGHKHADQASPVSLGTSTNEGPSATRSLGLIRSTSSVAEDIIGKKGQYGRFIERWFSRKDWTTEKRRVQGMSVHGVEKPGISSGQRTGLNDPQFTDSSVATMLDGAKTSDRTSDLKVPSQAGEGDPLGNLPANVTNTLLPKLLRTTRMLLGSRSFFFSYDIDITRRLGTKEKTSSEISLHKSVDPLVRHCCIYVCIGIHFPY